jgi:hypothetical protein
VAQHVGKPRDPSSTEYVYVTVWEDLESIRAFAGERWQEAVITPDEEHLLKHTCMGTTRFSHVQLTPVPLGGRRRHASRGPRGGQVRRTSGLSRLRRLLEVVSVTLGRPG